MTQNNQYILGTIIDSEPKPFDSHQADDFYNKSLSEHTRKAYRRVIAEFFRSHKNKYPTDITSKEVLAWRDSLIKKKQKACTVTFKLSVVRSFYEYLRAQGITTFNPAATNLVPPPVLPEEQAGKSLTSEEARNLLCGPDRSRTDGARDYALLLIMLRLSLRVGEVCSLKTGSVNRSHGRWIIRFKVKGGRERTLPLPDDVRQAVKDYLKLDEPRRRILKSDKENAWLFQPLVNYRTLEFDKPLSVRMVRNIVARWADYCGLKRLSPHDLRRTAITRALDQGLSYRQVQMMSGHRDPKTVMLYDHGRENLDQNAVNFLNYEK